MASNAISINRIAAKAVRDSELASRRAIAQDHAKRAARAALDAIKAARRAAEAANKADPRSASQAQREATRALEAAKSAELVAANVAGGHREPTVSERISRAIDVSARFLVLRDGRLVAACVDEDDALLLEGEFAELDRTTDGASCVVRTRAGKCIAGYEVRGGKMLAF